MKSVLFSIQPYWVFLIIAKKIGWNIGKEKNIEIRKNYPKAENWDKVAKIYCSKDKKSFNRIPKEYQVLMKKLLGKVIGEFVCDGIDRIAHYGDMHKTVPVLVNSNYTLSGITPGYLKKIGLNYEELEAYSDGRDIYGLKISDLKIYDKPKDLSEFQLIKPPQSWCYVKEGV